MADQDKTTNNNPLNKVNKKDAFMTGTQWVFLIIGLFILSKLTTGTIGAGERGIHTRFSAVTGKVYGEGLYFKIPFIESIKKMDVKIQKEEAQATAASRDLQNVNAHVALNYHVEPTRAADVYQNIGLDYKSRLIVPAMQEAVKSSTAKFTAEELITKREQVKDEVKKQLSDRLNPHGIKVDEFNIVNFQFSKAFEEAIEAKVTAEQNALAAKNKLQQVQFEADQRVAEAKGKAEALRVESEALTSNPQIVNLRFIEKWNGVLPSTLAGEDAGMFLPLRR